MWETSADIETSAPPEAVWALWEDPARWPEWNEDIKRAELDCPFERGARAKVRFRRSLPLPLTFTVTDLTRLRSFTDETRFPGCRMGHEHRIENGRVTNRLYLEGPAERSYGALMGRRLQRSVRRFVQREKALAEDR